MDFAHIASYDNYITANIILGHLQEEGINCWLKNEDSVLVNATGLIKLMVSETQKERALVLLKEFKQEE